MLTFQDLNIPKLLLNALADLGYSYPTPIQSASYPMILSGKNIVGIAQTGTGKTLAYMLPLLKELKYSKQTQPRILILVPTRELVLQVVEQINSYAKYMDVRVVGVYGGTNIKTQMQAVLQGSDILVATPGRLYDLALERIVKLNEIKKLVIDEVDVMLDLGLRFQLSNIFELMPVKRQNIMFSATMTTEVDAIIDDYFIAPAKITIAPSGSRLENIDQQSYRVENFYTKVNLLIHLLSDKTTYQKVLIFVSGKNYIEYIAGKLNVEFDSEIGFMHSSLSQNNRIAAIQLFDAGKHRILITTDIMARGLDLQALSHVISFDTPVYPENYIHRIGRAGRAEMQGTSILLFTKKEEPAKKAIEVLMKYKIKVNDFPSAVRVSTELIPEEKAKFIDTKNPYRNVKRYDESKGVHEKKDKNKKINLGGSYKFEIARKYKKPLTRGDKGKLKK